MASKARDEELARRVGDAARDPSPFVWPLAGPFGAVLLTMMVVMMLE